MNSGLPHILCYNWSMDKNFRVRMIVGVAMFVVSVIALYVFEAIPFKLIYGFFSLMAMIELFSFFKKKVSVSTVILAMFELMFLICSVIFAIRIDPAHFWYIILGVCGYDVFAYLFGKSLGGKIFGKARPFPKISKNKTWEGTILGLIFAISMCAILMGVRNEFESNWIYLFCGFLALVGDLFESYLKRKFNVKDSNSIVIKNPVFEKLEMLVGGSEGHGGFLDRLDSIAFACTVLLIAGFIVS